MKIAQVAPIWLPIPPEGYGGAEVIINLLTEELVKRGHDVTLFASGDSKTKANLFSVSKTAPGLSRDTMLDIGANMKHLYNMFQVLEKQKEFDLIHWHYSKDIAPIMFASLSETPSIITIHNHFGGKGGEDVAEISEHYKNEKYFVSISNAHRKHFPFSYIDTVYNGVEVDDFEFNQSPEKYFVWIGRFVSFKGAHVAIKVAKALGVPLKLAAMKDENSYFKEEIEPHLGKDGIEYVGEVNFEQKNKLLKNAVAFLNPILWDEPFGLVVPEANACGTPIITFGRGSMPEIVQNGVNGFSAKPGEINEMIKLTKQVLEMSEDEYTSLRFKCRSHALENFSVAKMTDGYEKVYEKVLSLSKK